MFLKHHHRKATSVAGFASQKSKRRLPIIIKEKSIMKYKRTQGERYAPFPCKEKAHKKVRKNAEKTAFNAPEISSSHLECAR
jgi:hypothetical protein